MPNKNLKGTLGTRSLLALLTLAIFAIWPPGVSSFDTFFAPNCGGCHVGQTLANSCGMCHAHGVHSSTAQNDFNVTGVPNKTTYAPGETVSVVVSGGYRATAARAVLYDEVGTQIDISSGATAGGIAPVNAPLWPVTLSAPAPTTPGAYIWTVSWYGHKYDLTETGGGTTFFGPNWTPDTGNLNHGWENVFVNFTVVAAALSITTTSPLPSGAVGTAYSTTLTATGGTTPYTWSITTGSLPAGLSLNASTGAITGTPTTAGTSNFTVQVSGGGTATKAFALTINAATAPTITTASPLPSGTVGTAYSTTLTATGGLSPYSWSVSAGALPAGLNLNGSTGAITGTPTTAGTFNFTIQVTGTNAASSTKDFALTINPAGAPDTTPPTVLSASPDNNATGVVVTAVSATFSEAISSDNVTTTSFNLTRGVDNVAGSVSVNGAVATFIPSVALADNTTYTATLTTGITDLAGNPLGADYTWSFTTGTTVVPPPPPPISLFGRGGGGGGCAMAGSGSGVKGLVGAYGILMLTILGLVIRNRRKRK